MPSYLIAGDFSNGVQVTSSNDNALTIQTGPNGGKVNAIALASDGTMTLNKPMAGGSLTLATAQATTSGTTVDFTGIPSWVKRITVMFNGVSTNGTALVQAQLGAGSVTASGYLGTVAVLNNTSSVTGANHGNGFYLENAGAAAVVRHGSLVFTLVGSNTWTCSGAIGRSDAVSASVVGGVITLGGTLDRMRLTTFNGTDTFDAGSVNIMYEG